MIKDWKKTKKWNEEGFAFVNMKTAVWLQGYKKYRSTIKLTNEMKMERWVVQNKHIEGSPEFETHKFKTKSQALKFAKSYMKKH